MTDALRLPPPLDPTTGAYKDWLHVNLFDPATGAVGLINVSLHGSPEDPRSRAVGAALVHRPGAGWLGNVEVMGLGEAGLYPGGIALERTAVVLDRDDVVHVAAGYPEDGLLVRARAVPVTRAVDIEERLPFGPGWISWRVAPRLRVEGTWLLQGVELPLDRAIAYHDHNWGRWHWGDDVGWDWGACVTAEPAATLVVSRSADRLRRAPGRALLIVEVDGVRRTFAGPAVALGCAGRLDARPRRFPGALAAARQDRARPHLPERITIRADDGFDRCSIRFRPESAAQLIAADPIRRGWGFIHEMAGTFEADVRIGGRTLALRGPGIFEHVD
jgi:hypothetical protein